MVINNQSQFPSRVTRGDLRKVCLCAALLIKRTDVKMSKKKRAAHLRGAAAASSGAASSNAPTSASFAPSLVGNGDMAAEKQRARRAIYAAKSVVAEIKADTAGLTPLALERLLWVHNVVAITTETARVLDEVRVLVGGLLVYLDRRH